MQLLRLGRLPGTLYVAGRPRRRSMKARAAAAPYLHCSCPSEPVACRAAQYGDGEQAPTLPSPASWGGKGAACSPSWVTALRVAPAASVRSDAAVHDRTVAAGVRLRRSP